MTENEETMSLDEAARYLGISKSTVYRRLNDMNIKPVGYSPLLKRQKESKYRKVDIDKIKELVFQAA